VKLNCSPRPLPQQIKGDGNRKRKKRVRKKEKREGEKAKSERKAEPVQTISERPTGHRPF